MWCDWGSTANGGRMNLGITWKGTMPKYGLDPAFMLFRRRRRRFPLYRQHPKNRWSWWRKHFCRDGFVFDRKSRWRQSAPITRMVSFQSKTTCQLPHWFMMMWPIMIIRSVRSPNKVTICLATSFPEKALVYEVSCWSVTYCHSEGSTRLQVCVIRSQQKLWRKWRNCWKNKVHPWHLA